MGNAVAVWERARRIADDLLFPAAMTVEEAGRVPAGHLDQLAREGFYGLVGPATCGGLDASAATVHRVIETLASGCLSTAFVWLQHHGAVRAARSAAPAVGQRWLGPLCRGERRAGLALGGALPGPPLLRAERAGGGYLLDGVSPWVTGWGLIDTIHAAARDEQGNVVTALLDTAAGPSLAAEPLRMVAVMASGTVQLRFERHFVPASQVTSIRPHDDWLARDALGLRPNGSLALGVAARCCALLGPGPLDDQLRAARAALDAAGPAAMPVARAAAAQLALRASAALVTACGSRAILASQDPQRLAREALFLLVFATRPAIKESLSGQLVS